MKRLLVVDDDPSAVDALQSLLELDGYEVVAMTSSARAVERLAAERFDALVTDLEMPDVHGVELTRLARAQRPALPVFVVSAYAGSPAARQAQALGAARVLSKPLEYDDLVAALSGALGAP